MGSVKETLGAAVGAKQMEADGKLLLLRPTIFPLCSTFTPDSTICLAGKAKRTEGNAEVEAAKVRKRLVQNLLADCLQSC